MNRATSFLVALGMLTMMTVLAGCVGAGFGSSGSNLALSSFTGQTYNLSKVNGNAFDVSERQPTIEFGAENRISGVICNRFIGQGELTDGVLYVRNMASTKMVCMNQDLTKFEYTMSHLLMQGATISINNRKLTLRDAETVLEFVRQ